MNKRELEKGESSSDEDVNEEEEIKIEKDEVGEGFD